MPAPTDFPSSTSNFSLPLLFAGQSQKEFFVNEAIALIDAHLHRTVVSSQPTPPAIPNEGEAYRVTSGVDDWSGQDDTIAVFIGGTWRFQSPVSGMTIFDRNAGQFLHFSTTWSSAAEPALPQGGAVVDSEARTAIEALIQALKVVGILT